MEIGKTATNKATGEQIEWDGLKWVPVKASKTMPVGRTASNEKGERITWDGKKWVPYDAVARPLEIAEAGLREGMADLVSLPNLMGQMAAQRGPTQVPQQIRGMPAQMRPTADQMTGFNAAGEALAGATPTREQLMARAERNVGPMVEPQEASGRYLKSAMRLGTGGAVGGPVGIGAGVVGGIAQQAAVEGGAPPYVQVIAGLGAPLIAGGIASMARTMAPAASKQLGEALRGATRAEFLDAENRVRMAAQQGNPITWSEALNASTRGRFGQLAQLQRVVEQSPGGQALNNLMAGRLDAARNNLTQNLDQIGPMPQGEALRDVAPNIQEASTAAVRGAEQARTAAASPLYQQAYPDQVPAQGMQTIIGDINTQIAHAGDPGLRRSLVELRDALIAQRGQPAQYDPMGPITGSTGRAATVDVPQTRAQELMNITKSWRSRLRPQHGQTVSDEAYTSKAFSAIAGPILSRVDDLLENSSAAYQAGQRTHQNLSQTVVQPAQRSIAGDISNMGGTPDITAQLNKIVPLGAQGARDPAAIRRFVADVGPQNATPLIRAGLQSEFDNVTREFATAGVSPNRGAGLWAAISGNPSRRANLQAFITSLPRGHQTWGGFANMLRTLDAQRYRLPANSQTAFATETVKALQGKGIPLSLEDINPLTLFQGEIAQAGKLRRYRLNSENLANILLDPNARVRLERLARLEPSSREARRLVSILLTTYATESEPLSQPPPEGR